MNSLLYFKNRNSRRVRVLRKMSAMREAKERKRLANPPDEPPRLDRAYLLELGLRNVLTGETAWVPFKSVRDAANRLAVVRDYYEH